MRHLISTLQTHNQQMKGEVVKYKIRLRETQAELNQVGPGSETEQKAFLLVQRSKDCCASLYKRPLLCFLLQFLLDIRALNVKLTNTGNKEYRTGDKIGIN